MEQKDKKTGKWRDKILELPDEDIIKLVLDDFSVSEDWRKEPNIRNRRYRKSYFQKESIPGVSKQKDPGAETDGRSHIWVPLICAFVDTVVAEIGNSIFSTEPFVKIEPTEEDDEDASKEFENLFHFRARRSQMDLRRHFEDDGLFQACLYDFAIGRMGWRVESGYVPSEVSKVKEIVRAIFRYRTKHEKVEMVEVMDAVDRPEIEFLDTLLCYPDKFAYNFNGPGASRFFLYINHNNLSSMRRREKTKENPFGFYGNLNKLEETHYIQKTAEQETQGKDDQQKGSADDLVEELIYHTPFAQIVIGNRKVVTHKQKMYGYPFTKMTYVQPNHQWSGVGLAEGMEHAQLDVNQLYRLRRDNINYIVNAIGVVNRAIFAEQGQLDFRSKPGKMWQINMGDPSKAIWYHHPPDTTQTITQDIAFQLSMVERHTGVGENRMGVHRAGGRRTAFEADLVAKGGDTRLGKIARTIEQNNLTDIVMMDYNLEQLYLTDEVRYRILGKHGVDWRTITRKSICHKGSFDIKPVGTTQEASRTLRLNQFLQSFQMVIKSEALMQLHDLQELSEQLWARMGEKDPKRFLKTDDKLNYKIPPDIENILLIEGHELGIGNYDNDKEHLGVMEAFEAGGNLANVPPENVDKFNRHRELHQQRMQSMEQGQGQKTLPQAESNVLAQPFDKALGGGMRTPAGEEELANIPGVGGGEF